MIALYYLLPQRFRWYALLAGSFVFYGFSGISNLLYIIATILSSYFLTVRIGNVYKGRDARIGKDTPK
jgi:hypothetical protein